jgi:hypothetical protein
VDIWTLDQLIDAVNDASTSSALVHVPNDNTMFKAYRDVVSDAYKPVKDIQKFQIFSMRNESPGVVACRKGPDGEEVLQDLRRKYDGIVTDDTRGRVLFDSDLKQMPNPPPNHEKNHTIYHKVRPYVPEESKKDPLYSQPDEEIEMGAKDAKKARAVRSKAAKKGSRSSSLKPQQRQLNTDSPTKRRRLPTTLTWQRRSLSPPRRSVSVKLPHSLRQPHSNRSMFGANRNEASIPTGQNSATTPDNLR